MHKEKVVGFLVVIIAIPDCKYLLYISMTIKRDICIYTGNQENPWYMDIHCQRAFKTITIESLFLSYYYEDNPDWYMCTGISVSLLRSINGAYG